MISLLHYNRY
uniref:Uncharacterized protein n=1 Tax=Arundo donax TaxID=35708 RepID=A0A0A9BI72_ARUDO